MPRTFMLIGIVLLVLAWGYMLSVVGVENIIAFIGTENVYVVIFFTALIAGTSSLTSTSYYLLLGTLAFGGTPLIPLAVAGGLGITVGDIVYYALGYHGRKGIPERCQERMLKIGNWFREQRRIVVQLAVFAYHGLIPFVPTDLSTILLGVFRYPLRHVIIPITLGNITLAYLTVLIAEKLS